MNTAASPLRWDGDDLVLQVRLQPRARHDAVLGVHDGALKMQVTSAPEDGAANHRAGLLLADAFGVAPSQVNLESGGAGPDKRFRIHRPQRIPAQLLHAGV